LICCAGAEGKVALDDVYVAGRYVDSLLERWPAGQLTDAALVSSGVARRYDSARTALDASSSARRLRDVGLGSDVEACARESTLEAVPRLAAVAEDRVELDTDGSTVKTEKTFHLAGTTPGEGATGC
jgi:phosphosulfolactate phosphohydrolase-like enzyme